MCENDVSILLKRLIMLGLFGLLLSRRSILDFLFNLISILLSQVLIMQSLCHEACFMKCDEMVTLLCQQLPLMSQHYHDSIVLFYFFSHGLWLFLSRRVQILDYSDMMWLSKQIPIGLFRRLILSVFLTYRSKSQKKGSDEPFVTVISRSRETKSSSISRHRI